MRSLLKLQEVASGLVGVSLPAGCGAVRDASWAGAATEEAAAAVPAMRAEVNELERKVRAEREAAWASFLRDQMETGTSWAHAFTKPKHSALVVLGAGGGGVDSPMHHLEKEQENLKKLWLCGEAETETSWNEGRYPLPADADPADVRGAAASFRKATAQVDGCHPRWFSFLLDPMLSALSKLWRLVNCL